MKKLSLITLLFAFCFFGSGIAETDAIRGKIEMTLPNAPTPTVEVNLDKEFFNLFINFTVNLPEYAEYAEMIEGVFIRTYEKESENLTEMSQHYQNTLKKEKWENLIKVKEQLCVSLLFADDPGVLHGIFISFTDAHNTTFVNIYGKIDFQKLGILFGEVVKYPALKGEACEGTNPNKPVVITDFSFHRGWYPIPLHEGRKPPYVRYLEPRCGRGQVSSHRIYNGTYVQTTSV